jgi:hypothetical protein
MIGRNRSIRYGLAAAVLGGVLSMLPVVAGAQSQIDRLIERVEKQDREIEALKKELKELRARTELQQSRDAELEKDLTELRAETEPPPKHPEYRDEDGETPLTHYDNPRIRLDVAAQINQAVNVAGDGKSTTVYFVDNDTSNSRVRLAGVGTFTQGPEVGTTFEMAFSPNPSSDVSQDNETVSDFVQVRRAEIWARDDRYGRLMFGRGSAAADNTAEFDLSLVSGPIMYSGIADIAGGLQFTDGDVLSGVAVNEAFFNFDSNRQNRFRYDTPMFGPVQLSASAGSNQRYDGALTFGGDYDHWTGIDLGGFTTLGALSISDPNERNHDYRVAGSGSLLHDATGLNFTASSGFDAGTPGGTPYNVYGKLGWNASLLDAGPTGFGVDYTWTENVSSNGDEGQGIGLAAVQVLTGYGIELYTQFRWYSLDRRQGPRFDDIFVGTTGTRVRF